MLCCTLKAVPVFIFANQGVLDMWVTALVSLRDITWEKIFDANGRKTLFSMIPKILQQGIAKLICRPDNGEILRVHIFGLHATDILHEASNETTLGTRIQVLCNTTSLSSKGTKMSGWGVGLILRGRSFNMVH